MSLNDILLSLLSDSSKVHQKNEFFKCFQFPCTEDLLMSPSILLDAADTDSSIAGETSDSETDFSKIWDDLDDSSIIPTPSGSKKKKSKPFRAVLKSIAKPNKYSHKNKEAFQKMIKASILTRMKKRSPEEMIVAIVNQLKQLKLKPPISFECESLITCGDELKSKNRMLFHSDVILKSLLTGNVEAAQNLSTFIDISGVLISQSISSMCAQANIKKSEMKLAAFQTFQIAPSITPHYYTGIGQITSAARSFMSAISVFIPYSVFKMLQFNIHIDKSSFFISKDKTHVAASFSWSSIGMIELGYQSELELRGLIRETYINDKIVLINLSFDSFALYYRLNEIFA
jgi:hypothetical protein